MNKTLPQGWRRVRLGEVLEQVNRVEKVDPDRTYRLLGVRCYANGCHAHSEVSGRELKIRALSTVRAGDISYNKMWTSKGAFGVIKPEQDGFGATSEYPLFAARDRSVSPDFIECVFRQPMFWAAARALCKGTTQRARLNPNDFLRLAIALPPPREQERIVAIHRAIHDAIRTNENVTAQLRRLRRLLMDDLLSRGLPARRSRLKNSPLGPIPEKWRVQRLSELAVVQTGLAKNKEHHSKGTIDVPYLRVANVQDGYVDTAELKCVSIGPAEISRYSLQVGDVLLTEGGDNDKLGRGCVWDGRISPCLHQNHVFAVRCQPDLLPQFLSMYTASARGRKYFLGASKQTTNLASVNSTQLKALPVPLPQLREQREICLTVDVVEGRLREALTYTKELTDVRPQLIQALLSGQSSVGGNK